MAKDDKTPSKGVQTPSKSSSSKSSGSTSTMKKSTPSSSKSSHKVEELEFDADPVEDEEPEEPKSVKKSKEAKGSSSSSSSSSSSRKAGSGVKGGSFMKDIIEDEDDDEDNGRGHRTTSAMDDLEYNPPEKFAQTSASVVEAFSKKLERAGEVWLIRLPKEVTVNQLNGLKLKTSGKKISGSLKKSSKSEQAGGVEYVVQEAEDSTESSLLAPLVVKDQKLVKSSRQFKKFLTVKMSVDPTDCINAVVQPVVQNGHPYVQPEVLQLRYQPFGSSPAKSLEDMAKEAHAQKRSRETQEKGQDEPKKKKAKLSQEETPEKSSKKNKEEVQTPKTEEKKDKKDKKDKEKKKDKDKDKEKDKKEKKKEKAEDSP